jgi:hypothetical protein
MSQNMHVIIRSARLCEEQIAGSSIQVPWARMVKLLTVLYDHQLT